MPALDGLRAAAVVAVLLYHGDVAWARGGFLGVDAFFVLSGFLITGLLLAEWQTTGGIDLPHFWRRRARRLLPALFLVLGAAAVLMAGLFTPGTDPARVYYGTDTRAQSLLIGAGLALLLERRRVGTTRIARRFLHTTAIGAALLLAWAWARTPDDATWLYRGG